MSFMELPLHGGSVPRWLFRRMVSLASQIVTIIVEEYGPRELILRISDPLWFQAFSTIIGFDWDSSGTTTVTTAVLRQAFKRAELVVTVAGGKGKAALRTPEQLELEGQAIGAPTSTIEKLKKLSRLAAKVDSCLLQDGYALYHHAVFLTSEGFWAIVQQGMNPELKMARRYHWNFKLRSPSIEPHSGLLGLKVHSQVLNLTSRESEEARKLVVDLANEPPSKLRRELHFLKGVSKNRSLLTKWMKDACVEPATIPPSIGYRIDHESVNWQALERAYQLRPRNIEELLLIRGMGPSTVRALALLGELIYGCRADWRDPLRFGYAFGGKDGIPYPVNRHLMDKVIGILRQAIEEARVGNRERLLMLRRLQGFVGRAKAIYYLKELS